MASMTMAAASFLGGSTMTKQPFTAQRRGGLIVAKSSNVSEGEKRVSVEMKKNKEEEESVNGRRDLVFAAAASAVAFSFGRVALADEEEPARGTPEAKKKYYPICVTMPTARICHKVK